MHERVTPLYWIYLINERLYNRALDGVATEDVCRRVGTDANSMLFVAGHLMTSRFGLLGILGDEAKNPWPGLFSRGETHQKPEAYPSIDEIRSAWNDASERFRARLESASEAELAAPAPFEVPAEEQTVLGAVAFLAMHESYHIGQFSVMRKLLGYESLVG